MDAPTTSLCDLPEGIIDNCLKQLQCVKDFLRCSAVCKSWYSIITDSIHKKQYPKSLSPWLMLTPPDDDEYTNPSTPQNFFNLADNKMIAMNLGTLSRGKRCWGSSFGWILTMGLDLSINLFNPLTKNQLSLPSQTTFEYPNINPERDSRCRTEPSFVRQAFIHKLILSSDPCNSTLPIMAIYEHFGFFAIAKPGDESWTYVTKPLETAGCMDAIFFKGHFYVVNRNGELLICDVDSPSPSATLYDVTHPYGSESTNNFYLAEISDELHLIERSYAVIPTSKEENLHYNTNEFIVHKLDFDTKKWDMLEDFGDHALFLGSNNSFAVSTTEYPQFQRNSIYFSHDHTELLPILPYDDMGVYDYTAEKMVKTDLYIGNDVPTEYNRPIFFIPGF